jgi:hypothetical protein
MAKFDAGDDSLSDDDFDKSLKKSSKWPYFAVAAVVVVGLIAGVLRYSSTGATRERLVRKVQRCEVLPQAPGQSDGLPVSAECMQLVSALSAQMPAGCPKVLVAIEEAKERTPQNLLLYAILNGRARAWRGKKLGPKVLEGDECLEKAVLHVHLSQRGTNEAPGVGLAGLDGYNNKLLDKLQFWIVRIKVLPKLSVQSAANIYDRLQVHGVNLKKIFPEKANQESISKILRKAVFSRMTDIYSHVVKIHLAHSGAGKAERAVKFPEYLDDDIGYKLDPKHPLAKVLLHTYFVRLPFAAVGEKYLMRWHKDLFRRHLLDKLEWEKAMAAMLEKLSQRHLGLLLKFLEANPELPLTTGGKVPGWYQHSLAMFSTQSDPSHRLNKHLFTALMNVAARRLPGAPVQRLILLNGLYFPFSVQKWLARGWRRDAQAGELARAGLITALVLGLGKHEDFDWLRKRRDFPEYSWLLRVLQPGSCAQGCPKPAQLRRAEQANLADGKKKHNLYMELDKLEKQLKMKDANYRAFAHIPTAYYPMKQRLTLVEAGLVAPEPSVRAFAVLGLSLGLTNAADIKVVAARLVKLSKDPSWLVRLLVFYRLWILEQSEHLKPFFTDPTPRIVAGWRQRLATWKTPDLVSLLARKDRAAGMVLPVLAARSRRKKDPWPVDWKGLTALVNHADPWTRIQLVQHFGKEGQGMLDWGALLTAKELTVRAVALDFWVEHQPGPPIKKVSSTIVGLLSDPHYGIKRLAALVLARLRDKSAVPALKKLLAHPSCSMRNVAGKGLATLQGGTYKPTRCAFELHGL